MSKISKPKKIETQNFQVHLLNLIFGSMDAAERGYSVNDKTQDRLIVAFYHSFGADPTKIEARITSATAEIRALLGKIQSGTAQKREPRSGGGRPHQAIMTANGNAYSDRLVALVVSASYAYARGYPMDAIWIDQLSAGFYDLKSGGDEGNIMQRIGEVCKKVEDSIESLESGPDDNALSSNIVCSESAWVSLYNAIGVVNATLSSATLPSLILCMSKHFAENGNT